MKKDKLKGGMKVKFRNGTVGVVFRDIAPRRCLSGRHTITDIILFTDKSGFLDINNDLDDDLRCTASGTGSEFDIMGVTDLSIYSFLWERDEPKELTVEEVEKLLGYGVKIIGGGKE